MPLKPTASRLAVTSTWPSFTNGKGVIPEGTRIPVPNQKLKWDEGNPTGHGIIFIGSNGQVFCYVTPGGV